MSHTTFAALPPGSRIWIFVAQDELTPEASQALHQAAERWFKIWKSKEDNIKGCYEIQENRFLKVGADESMAPLSGCSVDAMMARIMKLEEELGLKLVDRTRIYFRDAEGKVQSRTRPQFRALIASGEVNEDTIVCDTTLSHIEQLRANRFEVPLKECWHAKLFLPQAANSSPA